jgi:hypothetical protein
VNLINKGGNMMLKRCLRVAMLVFAILILFAWVTSPTIAKVKVNCNQVEIVKPPGNVAVNLETVIVMDYNKYSSSTVACQQVYNGVIESVYQLNVCIQEKVQSINDDLSQLIIIADKSKNQFIALIGTSLFGTGPPTLIKKEFPLQRLYAVRNHQNKTTL